jgi:riboflavin kinase / FMN adenylyltransferase
MTPQFMKKKLQLFRDLKNLSQKSSYIATIGNYDGIHLGHQRILQQIKHQQKKLLLPSLVIIFEPLPTEYFLATHAPARLTSLAEKIALLAQYEIENVLCLRFNASLANMSATEFIQKILLETLNIKYLIIGDDFSFGHHRAGNFELLQQYTNQGLITEKIDSVYLPGHNQFRISSTHIRQALANANFDLAKRLLGRPYTMSGHVAHGNGLGQILGFPTANIHLKHKVAPLKGIYTAKIYAAGVIDPLSGVINIGTRPTVDGKNNLLEVHLLDFNQDIYGKKLVIEFLHKLRDERKFDNLDLLRQQITEDVKQAEILLLQQLAS